MVKAKKKKSTTPNIRRVNGGKGAIKCSKWKQCVDAVAKSKEAKGLSYDKVLKLASGKYSKTTGKCKLTALRTLSAMGCKRKGKSKHQDFKGAPRPIFLKKTALRRSPWMTCANLYSTDPAYKHLKGRELMSLAGSNYISSTSQCGPGGKYMKARPRREVLEEMTMAQLRRTKEYSEYRGQFNGKEDNKKRWQRGELLRRVIAKIGSV